jgi:HlyD family secretion protein
MTGTVSLLNVELGQRVVGTSMMAGTELLRVADLSIMEAEVDVNENDIVRVNIGDTTNIDVDAYITYGEIFKGVVTEIASTANPKPSADAVTEFKVKIRILNDSFKNLVEEEGIKNPFKPGMTASVEIITQIKKDIVIVPIASVTTKSKKQYVFVEDEMTSKMIEVTTGISDFENIEILSGLSVGDKVIKGPYIAISQKLKDGTIISESKDSSKEKGKNSGDRGISVSIGN